MLIYIIVYLYNFIFLLLLPFLLLKLLFKSIKVTGYRQRLLERLGIFNFPKEHNDKTNIWIHAVSVGEIIACLPIINQIKQDLPNAFIIITCTTAAGSKIIKKKLAGQVFHVYFPFDIGFAIKNFLKKTKPKLLIIIEKELWPNTILNCSNHNIPIIIANAQISKKSFYRYLWIKPLISYCLNKINFICAQTKFDGYKLKTLISSKNNILITGSSKFDAAFTENNTPDFKITNNSQPIWIAASTHPLEEEIILQAQKLILQKIPDALLILAPRHIERCNDLAKNLIDLNLDFVIHSKSQNKIYDLYNNLSNNHLENKHHPQVYLVDTIGELSKLYAISLAAFVGGSLIPLIGGHNVLEPAFFEIPIATGPYTNNCKEVVFRMKCCNGLAIVKDATELSFTMMNWLTNNSLRSKIGANAKNYLYNQTGASKVIANLAASLL